MLKRFLRLCSVILVLVMVFNMLPLHAAANVYSSSKPAASSPEASVESKGEIAAEVQEHRTEYSKEFKLNNGLYVSAVYSQPVHYEADGQWREIDNTLRAHTDGTYTNTEGVWDVRFPQQLSGSNSVTVTKDGYTLSFGMAGVLQQPGNLEISSGLQTAAAELEAGCCTVQIDGALQHFSVQAAKTTRGQIQTVDLTKAREQAQYEEFIVGKNVSQLLYTDVYTNTDIQYDLISNQIKESVILEAYSSTLRGYRYTLNVGDMIPVLQADGSIYLYDSQRENIVMVMPAPYLVDADNQYNHDIQVSLTGMGSIYTLSYILPTSWLASQERSWPVVLDPVVIANLSDSNIQDTTVISARPYEANYMRSTLQIGYSAADGISQIYLGFKNLPTLTSSDVIVKAVVSLNKIGTGTSTVPATVHKVNTTWQVEGLCWSNKPAFNATVEDYAMVTNAGRYYWDITDIARDWYSGNNTGMLIKASDEVEQSGNTSSWKEFYSCNYGNDTTDPVLAIYFRNNNGLESYWDYTSASAGRAGTGYINNYTGNLVWVRSDIGFGGNRMPVSISHVYNANDAIAVSDSNNSNDTGGNYFGLGNGWRTNFHQRIYQWSNDSSYYVWEDSDGTDHYFLHDSGSTYKDEDGLELILTTNGSGITTYRITDKAGNNTYFDTYGRLTRQDNNQATTSRISVTYTTVSGPQISTVTDGAGRVYSFTYTNNQLSRIGYYGTGSIEISYVTFTYSENQLIRVTDQDGGYSTYEYGQNTLLAAASDVDGYKLSYTYNTTNDAYQPYRVIRVVESDAESLGGELTFSYAHNETTITDVVNNQKQILQFNNFGNTISVQDEQGRAQFAQYANNDSLNTQSTEKANQLRLSSKLQNTVGNRVYNSNFEDGSVWSVWPDSTICENVTTEAYLGDHSLLFTANEWSCLMSDYFTIEAGCTYTFSAYVKGVSGKTYLKLVNRADMSETSVEVTVGSTDWKRVEISFTNPSSSYITACAQYFGIAGSQAYIDCAQVEKSYAPSRYNLLENGDFRHRSSHWANNDFSIATREGTSAYELDEGVMRVTGSPTMQKRMSQTVDISGSKDDTFVLSGWAQGDSAPLTNLNETESTTRQFAIIGTFNYTDGSTKEFVAQFNPGADSSVNWQYSAQIMVAEKAYNSITVQVAYDYNVNTACFDGIQLYKEEFGTSYIYDGSGNVISVKDLQEQTTTYEYSNNNLTKILQDNKAKMTYTYDPWNNVKTATSDEGIVYNFDYDSYGNNTSVSIVSGGSQITSSAVYTSDGNRLVSTTDAVGGITYYSYNADTNVLEWVKYPNDTDATRTNYTYDSMYRTASAAVNTNTGSSLSASYTYENDLLTEIETESTTYSFTYGKFAQRTGVQIGNRTLASYEYTDDRNYYLKKLAYGNGDHVQYEHDELGRIIKQTYEDGDTVTYKYNNDGDLASVTDSATGITTTYYYDLTGRLMKYVESGSRSRTVTYTYDSKNNLTSVYDSNRGTTSYAYDEDNRIISVTESDSIKTYAYDAFGRLQTSYISHDGDSVLTQSYGYKTLSATTTSTQLSSYQVTGYSYNVNLSYTYDANGNITSVSDGTYTVSYAYDSQNQLIRENNQKLNKTWTWAYDGAGNILSRSEYAYTTGTLGTPLSTKSYAYGDSGWGDLLTGFNGNAITYDDIGNMRTYGSRTFTWEHGRQLSAVDNLQMTYDENGLRLTKYDSITGMYYNYYYRDNRLVRMTFNNDDVSGSQYFNYDAEGNPVSADYLIEHWGYWDENGNHVDLNECYYIDTYYYITNIQGDVIALTDQFGRLLAEYTYDAWGNILDTTYYNDAQYYATYNPFRYRGYIYDIETGLYYLQSRYYDPEIGRFINADALVSTGQGFIGNNMFTYCLNNPVNMADYNGMDAIYVVEYNWFEGGLPIVGHAYLYMQNANGIWYFTEYTGTLPWNAKVYFSKANMSTINKMLNGDSIKDTDYIYIVGDFSNSYKTALDVSINNPNYGGYNLLNNNCSHYVQDLLAKGNTGDLMINNIIQLADATIPRIFYTYLKTSISLSNVLDKVTASINASIQEGLRYVMRYFS